MGRTDQAVQDRTGVSEPSVLALRFLAATAASDIVPLFPEVEEDLTKQQEKCRVLIFSNIESYYLDQLCAAFKNLKPDFVGDMEKANMSKPSPCAYYWVLKQAGMSVDDVIYCACPQWDAQGALAIGMKTIWLNRDDEPLAGMQPDHVVSDLCGVTNIVENYTNS